MHSLQLKRQFNKTVLFGVGQAKGNKNIGMVKLEISSKTSKGIIHTNALCLPKLTHCLPSVNVSTNHLDCFHNLILADPSYNKPGSIDLILDADVYAECLLQGSIAHSTGALIALNTIFGYVIICNIVSSGPSSTNTFAANVSTDVTQQLQRFWELEDVVSRIDTSVPQEEHEAEEHYKNNVQRLEDGRYMVRLPLKTNPITLRIETSRVYWRWNDDSLTINN